MNEDFFLPEDEMGEFEDAQNDAKDEPPRPLSSFQAGLGNPVRSERCDE